MPLFLRNIEPNTSEIQHPILGLYEGFPIIADLRFLISEIKKIPLFFTKHKRLHFRNPTSDIRNYMHSQLISTKVLLSP